MHGLLLQIYRSIVATVALLWGIAADAGPMMITVDTSALAGRPAALAFDFIGDQGNVASVLGFQSVNGPLTPRMIGNLHGDLASGLEFRTEGTFFNGFIGDFTLGGKFVFELGLSNADPQAGAAPDAFSLFLLETLSAMPLFTTSDPTGANALMRFDIDGRAAGSLNIFHSDIVVVSAVRSVRELPEPPTLLMALPIALLLLARCRKRTTAAYGASLALFLGASLNSAYAQEDLGSLVSIGKSGAVMNRTLGTVDYVVTITNTSSGSIFGPVALGIHDVGGPEVAVYNAQGVDRHSIPQVRVELPMGVLKPGQMIKVPLQFINPRLVAISYRISVTGTAPSPHDIVPVKVRVFLYSGNEDKPVGVPAGPGVAVKIVGVTHGFTDHSGEATIHVPVDVQSISAERAPSAVGSAPVDLMKAGNNTVDIVIDGHGEVYADGTLRIDEVRQRLLPNSFGSFTGRFIRPDGATIKVVELASVDWYDSTGRPRGELKIDFSVSADGTFRPVDVAALRELLQTEHGSITLTIAAFGGGDNIYIGDVTFYLAGNPVVGILQVPSSAPELAVKGLRVIGKVLNTDIVVSTVTDSDGKFVFPSLPDGNLSIDVETVHKGLHYYGSGLYALAGPINLIVPLSTIFDELNAVVPSSLSATASRRVAEKPSAGMRRPEDVRGDRGGAMFAFKENNAVQSKAANAVSVSVTAGAEGVPSKQTAKLKVSKGTAKVILRYNVSTDEYPYYVTEQSVFNDVWGIRLFSSNGAGKLFDIQRQINSQLKQSPIWRSDGSTGTIEHSFDVEKLAKDNDVELILLVSATNISDDYLATKVTAEIFSSGLMTIESVDDVAILWKTRNDKSYCSVPSIGGLNRNHRQVRLKVRKPAGATVTSLKVEMLVGDEDATIVDSAIGEDVVVEGADSVRSIITYKLKASTLNTIPPMASRHQYRYTLKAKDADGKELVAEKIESGKHPLWHIPSGFKRFGGRDRGGDDWTSRRTYLWMDTHRNLLQAINDVSGEHGKDLGHKTHDQGNDIDMYHFYTFPGADPSSGISNHNQLVTCIGELSKLGSQSLKDQDAGKNAAAQIRDWILVTRSGIDNLAEESDVIHVGYILGDTSVAGVAGKSWGKTLLKTGKVTVYGKEYDIVKSAWDNPKYRAWAEHHHHVHITLAPD